MTRFRQRTKERYAADPEAVLSRNRAYYGRNAEAIRAQKRAYNTTNREARSARDRAYRAANPHVKHNNDLRANYGMTLDGYNAMLADQGGICANVGCGTIHTNEKRLHVDHDHSCCDERPTCGKCVRGLICRNCNAALGLARDDPDRLLGLVQYLNRSFT